MLNGSAAPSDVWVLDRASNNLRQITFSPHAGVNLNDLVHPKLVRYKGEDGEPLTAWLWPAPETLDGARPLRAEFSWRA